MKLLANHLARVKLQAEEDRYANESLFRQQKMEIKRLSEELENARTELKALKKENTHQSLIAERENWRKLVDQLRKENEKLRNENNMLQVNSTVTTVESMPMEETKENVQEELLKKDAEIEALRRKLDYELEMKWIRKHSKIHRSNTTRLLGAVKEIISKPS